MSDYTPEHATPAPVEAPKTHPLLSSSTYDKLKPLTTMVMPAVVTFYLTLAGYWEWDNSEKVAGTLAAINVFMGVILAVATRSYNNSDEKFDGTMNVVKTEEKTTFQLELDKGPEVLEQQEQVALRVNKE